MLIRFPYSAPLSYTLTAAFALPLYLLWIAPYLNQLSAVLFAEEVYQFVARTTIRTWCQVRGPTLFVTYATDILVGNQKFDREKQLSLRLDTLIASVPSPLP